MNNTGKIKFKKESDKPKLRDSIIFIMIIILCVVTVVTIQLKSQQKRETDTLNSQRVERAAETAPVSNEVTEKDDNPEENKDAETDIKESLDLQLAAAKAQRKITTVETEKAPEEEEIPPDTVEAEAVLAQQPNVPEFSVPVSGKILKEYTSSELLYSKTLDDWRMHLGVDIAAPIGTEVTSCEEGTVEEILDDEEYGTTVTIRHNERLVTRYSNLAGKLEVSIGDKVTKGQKIGVIGDTAMYEILDEPHLHFSMSDNGAMVNPDKYIKLE